MFRETYMETGLRCHPLWLYLSCLDLMGLWQQLSSSTSVLCIYTFNTFLPVIRQWWYCAEFGMVVLMKMTENHWHHI